MNYLGENKEKKNFVSGLIKTFTILLSAKAPTVTKIKQVARTSVKITLELWPEQKQQSED